MLRDPTVQVLRRGTELVAMTPEVRRFFFEPAPLIITKANVVSRIHRRVHMDYIGVKTYGADGVRPARSASSASSRRRPTPGRRAEIPFLRHKVGTRAAVVRLSARQPRRQGAHQRARDLPARRAVPDRRRSSCSAGRGHPRSGDAAARARVCPRRPLRPVRLGAALRAARPLQHQRARAHRRTAGRGLQGPRRRVLPYFTDGPLVRVQFIVGRYDGADAERRCGRAGARHRRASCAPGRTARGARWPSR